MEQEGKTSAIAVCSRELFQIGRLSVICFVYWISRRHIPCII